MAEQVKFQHLDLIDYTYDFGRGVNNGIPYTSLPKNQLSAAVNTTVRGNFVGPRPRFRKIPLLASGYEGDALLQAIKQGKFQGAGYYNPDSGLQSLMAAISGKLIKFTISGNSAAVVDCTIPGDSNDPAQGRNWIWQAEKWIIVTDGTQKPPLFYDNTTTVRSNYGASITYGAFQTAPFTVPAISANVVVSFSNVTNLDVGDVVTHRYLGKFQVQNVAGLNVTLLNLAAGPVGATITVPTIPTDVITWVKKGNQLPPGRMGAYGMGRVWMSLVDGKQFVASDLVGGSSGTVANNFRDAVLQVTENSYLYGGGNFAVPGSYGDIRAMCFSENLDLSLGQGPLQIFTPNSVFSCNAPVDRTTWQSMTNPILSESAKGGGGLSQWSTFNNNSDIFSRSIDGIRSLLLTRREFNTWGNVPISREVRTQLDRDSEDLLGYTSGCVFDNRALMTTEGEVVENRGVIWKRLIVINNDMVSSLSGKTPSVYDALYWQGLNIFQILRGEFNGVQRCFAFTLNRLTDEIELWEVLKSSDTSTIYDEGDVRVVWSIETPMLDFGLSDPRKRVRCRLQQAEIFVNNLRGRVGFQVFYRPEFWPCWVPWVSFEECSNDDNQTDTSPSWRPNLGLPEPNPHWCDPTNNRPLREGYFFQVKVVVTGQCEIKSMRFTADSVPQPPIAPPRCTSICPSPITQ